MITLPLGGGILDYHNQAGTQFQTGIDSGASIAASITGSTLSWNITLTDQYCSPGTFHHLRLFDSPDGVSDKVLLDNIAPSLQGSLDISKLHLKPGAHKLYLKLVGKAGIFNKVSLGAPYSVQTKQKRR